MKIMSGKYIALLLVMPLLLANQGGCSEAAQSAAKQEQKLADSAQAHLLRVQPVPGFSWSLERHLAIEIYKARQRQVPTVTVVQSEFTGKVLWQCDSIGFPLPYATQLTNPQQGVSYGTNVGVAVINQPEPNGLYSPPQADGTWVPCVDEKGSITPVYEERKVTTFPRRVREVDGRLLVEGASSLTIAPRPVSP